MDGELSRPMREACEHATITQRVSFRILRHSWASLAVMAVRAGAPRFTRQRLLPARWSVEETAGANGQAQSLASDSTEVWGTRMPTDLTLRSASKQLSHPDGVRKDLNESTARPMPKLSCANEATI
jgi:hypothetical protein